MGATSLKEVKPSFSLPRTKNSVFITYAFLLCFIVFSLVLAFNPVSPSYSSSSSSKVFFSNIFYGITCTYQNARDTFSYDKAGSFASNVTITESPGRKDQSQNKELHSKARSLKPNINKFKAPESQVKVKNQTQNKGLIDQAVNSSQQPAGKIGGKRIAENGVAANLTSSLSKKQRKEPLSEAPETSKTEEMMKQLMNCDFFDGEWVKDDSYPLYKPGSCSLIDEQFNCFLSGRPDQEFQQYKWKPKACSLPRSVITDPISTLFVLIIYCVLF